MNNVDIKEQILLSIKTKSATKLAVTDNSMATLNLLKKVLKYLSSNFNSNLKGTDKRVLLEYKDRGPYEAQLKIAGDLLIFSLHSNVFEFDRDHPIQKMSYSRENPLNTYCGVISIYNFLYDSFRYNRVEDLGYLVARIFVNRENHFFVEGKRQFAFLYNDFGKDIMDKDVLRKIVFTSIMYCLDFDLLVQPYEQVKIASVAQVVNKIESARMQTGKRLGFTYNTDDIH
jgi:hypothetical protein